MTAMRLKEFGARMMMKSTLRFAGIPVLYAYFFVAWGALIGLMALVIERPD